MILRIYEEWRLNSRIFVPVLIGHRGEGQISLFHREGYIYSFALIVTLLYLNISISRLTRGQSILGVFYIRLLTVRRPLSQLTGLAEKV
jgi:hypothetical protein